VPGGQRCITAGYVRLRLRRYGFDPEAVDLRGEAVTVQRGPLPSSPPALAATPRSPTNHPQPEPPLVHRNQLVEVQVQCGAVTIRISGQACADGREDEFVNVYLPKTNRTLRARVAGPGQLIFNIQGGVP